MAISFTLNPFTGNFDAIDQVTLANVGSSPNAQGASITSPAQVLTLQPANGSFPGVLLASDWNNFNTAYLNVSAGPSKVLYVDSHHPGTYTPDGSILRPFTTIGAAISQIATNADNSTYAYVIYVMAGTYNETLTFNNSAFYNIAVVACNGATQGGAGAVIFGNGNAIVSTSNNTQLAQLMFVGCIINGNINLTGDTNGTNFGSTQILFSSCSHNFANTGTLVLNNVNNVSWYGGQLQQSGSGTFTFTNVAFAYISELEGLKSGTTLNLVNNGSGNQPSQFSGNYLLLSSTKCYSTLSIDAGSEMDMIQTYFGTSAAITNNGTIASYESVWKGTLTLNNGSTTNVQGDNFKTAPTVNAGATLTETGIFFGSNARLSALGASQVVLTDSSKNLTSAASLSVSNGGTGATSLTAHNVLLGEGTSTLGFAAPTATIGVPLVSAGASSDPAFGQLNLASSSAVTGALAVANGGTGQSTYTDGQLLIGNTATTSLTKATLTAGTGISITNGNGSISIASTVTAGANTALSNLAAVAINTSLLPGTDNSINLGSASKSWAGAYIRALFDGSNVVSVDPYNRDLVDSGNATSIDFNGRHLKDSSAGIQLSWSSSGVKIGVDNSLAGVLAIANGTANAEVDIQANAVTSTYNFNLPATAGTSGQVLTSAGGGSSAMTWTTPSAGTTTNVSGVTGAWGGIEAAEQKAEHEHYGIITEPLDNSQTNGFFVAPPSYGNVGYLMDSFSSGGTTTPSIVWSPMFLNSSDQDTTTTTNWTAEGGGGSVTTSATNKVGGHSLQWTNTTTTSGGVKYDAGAATLSANGHSRLYFWINLPSVTAFNHVYVEIDIDATNNSTWNLTTTQSGGSFSTGWNLCFVDLANTAATSSGGTGWNTTQLFRYCHIGVVTGSSQTYTGILLNGIYFSLAGLNSTNPSPVQYIQIGSEVTLFDGTNRDSMIIDHTNTQVDGPLTIAASLSHTYSTPGVSSSTAANIARSTFVLGGNEALWASNYFLNSSNALAGNITTTQEVRIASAFRDALSSNSLGAYACVNTPQAYTVSSTSTNTIVINDASNTSANLKSGNVCWVFRTIYVDGQPNFVNRGSFTLTSDSTPSGGLTTLTGTGGVPAGTAVGDYVVKDSLTVSNSVVSVGSNESFSALTNNSSPANPDGVLLYNTGIPYPYQNNVWGHWFLGGLSASQAQADQFGVGGSLTLNGSLTISSPFKNGQFGVTGFSSSSNYYSVPNPAVIGGYRTQATSLTYSIWINYPGTTSGSSRVILSSINASGNNGYELGITGSASTIYFHYNDSTNAGTITSSGSLLTGWNHILINVTNVAASGSGAVTMYLNGSSAASSSSFGDGGTSPTNLFIIGNEGTSVNPLGAGPILADLVIWRNSPAFTSAQVNSIYNAGLAAVLGFGPMLKYRYNISSITGQTVSLKASLTRTTTAVTPFITKMGIIKTG